MGLSYLIAQPDDLCHCYLDICDDHQRNIAQQCAKVSLTLPKQMNFAIASRGEGAVGVTLSPLW